MQWSKNNTEICLNVTCQVRYGGFMDVQIRLYNSLTCSVHRYRDTG